MSTMNERLNELGIVLSDVPTPAAKYVMAKTVGNLVYTSGCLCMEDGQLKYEGKVGRDLNVEQGYDAARVVMINCLAVLKTHLADLDRIKQIVKVTGFVNSAPGFSDQPKVLNGASDLLVDLFGEKGWHTRSAVGTSELPFQTPVEIEMIVEV